VSDSAREQPVDPWAVEDATVLLDALVDETRTVCLPVAEPAAIARAIVAMANSRGGDIVVGARTNGDGRVAELTGVEPEDVPACLATATETIDPPVTHLVQQRTLPADGRAVAVVHVRLSPSAPHLITTDGGLYRIAGDGVQPIRSRRALDDLYARGRGERERADRLVEAMIEKLTLAHYAFYSLAVIASTHVPSGEPYRAAFGDRRWLTPPEDPFIAAFTLAEQEPRVGPGEIELRTPDEVNGYIRITRSGCVAAGEVQRRPYHNELDSAGSLEQRLARLINTVARILGAAPDTLMLPQVFVEGVRGLHLVRDPERRIVTGNAPQDTARHPLTAGDARDEVYLAGLPGEAMSRLAGLFPG
jgi:hypothetical protein